jgi:hypothetical protein
MLWNEDAMKYNGTKQVDAKFFQRPHTPLSSVFTNDFWGTKLSDPKSHKSYRPLTVLSFRADFMLLPDDVKPLCHKTLDTEVSSRCASYFHAGNVALHVVATCLTVVVTKCVVFNGDCIPAALTGALFAAHPIHTEAVSNIAGRAEILACVFFLLALWQFHYANSILKLFITVLWATAAVLSKEQGITVFGVCVAYDLVRHIDFASMLNNPRKAEWRPIYTKIVWRSVGLVVSTLSLLCARFTLHGHQRLPEFGYNFNRAAKQTNIITRVLSLNHVAALHLQMLVFPVHLCVDWSHSSIPLVEGFDDIRNVKILIMYLLLFCLCYWAFICTANEVQTRRRLAMSLILLIVPFTPASNLFFYVGFTLAERVLYTPSLGYCVLLAFALHRVIGRQKGVFWLVSAAIIGCYVLRTRARNEDWIDGLQLHRSGVVVNPRNELLLMRLSQRYRELGRLDEAVWQGEQAIRLQPTYTHHYSELATALSAFGPSTNETRISDVFNLGIDRTSQIARMVGLDSHFEDCGGHRDVLGMYLQRQVARAGQMVQDKHLQDAQRQYHEVLSIYQQYHKVLTICGLQTKSALAKKKQYLHSKKVFKGYVEKLGDVYTSMRRTEEAQHVLRTSVLLGS